MMKVPGTLLFSVLFASAAFGQAYSPWGVTDTVTSGNCDDRNPVLDHGGMESRTYGIFVGSQWLVFDRTDNSGSSVIAKRYSNRTLTWFPQEYVLAAGMPAGEYHHPDVATLNDSTVLAVWEQQANGYWQIVFSRFDGETWSQPEMLTRDTVDNVTPRVRILEEPVNTPAGEAFIVGWKNGGEVRYCAVRSGGADSIGTAVSTGYDSLEFDICQSGRLFYLVWTGRDSSGFVRLHLYGMNVFPPAYAFRALDTLDFAGSVVNPHIVTFFGLNVFFDSRVSGRWRFYSAMAFGPDDTTSTPVQEYLYGDTNSDNLNVQGWSGPVLVDSWSKSTPRYKPSLYLPGFFVYESRSSRDSSLIFSSNYSPDTMSGPGYNCSPTIASFVSYNSGKQFGLAAWQSDRTGRSHIYARRFSVSGDPVVEPPQPFGFNLSQNFPNPFNPTTTISYRLSSVGNVSLVVYDVLGRKVRTLVDERQVPGEHTVAFDGSGMASGVYFCRLEAGTFNRVVKMLLMK